MTKIRSLLKSVYKGRMAYLFLLPLFTGLLIFSYYPAFSGLYHSFFDWDSIGKATFIGLDNFKNLFGDKVFLNSFAIMAKLQLPRLAISVIVPLFVAELIFGIRSVKTKYFYRVMVLLPMVAPGVVGALIWKNMYDPNNGLMVNLCRVLGIVGPQTAVDWLGDPGLVIYSILLMGFPWIGGTAVLIYFSGLMDISTEVIESSLLDGAGRLRRFFKIDLPMLMGQIRYFFIFGMIGLLQDYSTQVVLTKGGPGFSTMVPGYYMFNQAFQSGKMGYASAVGTTLFVIILAVTLLSLRFLKLKD